MLKAGVAPAGAARPLLKRSSSHKAAFGAPLALPRSPRLSVVASVGGLSGGDMSSLISTGVSFLAAGAAALIATASPAPREVGFWGTGGRFTTSLKLTKQGFCFPP